MQWPGANNEPLREKRALLEEEHEDDKEVGESYPVI